jgi:hypothetical protein
MTDIGSTGYMTDSQIMAWLEQKATDQYSNLGDQMAASEDRSKEIKGLTDARAAVDAGKPDDAFQQLHDLEALATDPNEQGFLLKEQIELLGWVQHGQSKADALLAAIDASSLSGDEKQALTDQIKHEKGVMAANDTNAPTQQNTDVHNQQQKRVSGELDSRSQDLGRIDQLALINIQQLVSDAKQTDQLASNILASRDQTNNAIVGNIRG